MYFFVQFFVLMWQLLLASIRIPPLHRCQGMRSKVTQCVWILKHILSLSPFNNSTNLWISQAMRFQSDFFVTAFQNWREMGKADDEEEELDRETVGRCLIWWWWCGANGGDDDVDCEEADNDDGCGGETVDDGEADVFFSSEKLPKNCLLRSSRSFERSSPFLTGAKKY